MLTYLHIYIYIHIYMYACIYVYVYTYIYMHTHIHMYIHTCIHVRMYTCIHIYICSCALIHNIAAGPNCIYNHMCMQCTYTNRRILCCKEGYHWQNHTRETIQRKNDTHINTCQCNTPTYTCQIWTYIYTYIYTRVSMHKYTFIRIYMYAYLHRAIRRAAMGRAIQGDYICIHIQMYTYINIYIAHGLYKGNATFVYARYKCTYIHIYTYMQIHIFTYIHVYAYTCIHNKIYIHTRIRIHTPQFTGPAIGRTIPGQGDTHVYMLQMYIYTHVQMYISKCIHI